MKSQKFSNLPDGNAIKDTCSKLSYVVKKTPVMTSDTLNKISGANLFFKCENFQKAGSFKFRGANSALLHLANEEAIHGVCTHSSGNHAQALSLAAKIRNIKAHIVMPRNAPEVKVDAVKSYGGLITFCEPTLEAREKTLEVIQKQTQAIFVHPYNDYRIMEGQAGCFYEFLQQTDQKPDYAVVPLGGGGLLSGTLLSARYFSENTKVIGAEPLNANDAWQSFQQKKFVPSVAPDTIADGLKTSLGSLTYPIIMNYVEDIITAREESIIHAMYMVWERMKIVIEPSAAVPLAAILEDPGRFAAKNVAVIFSGGNVNLKNLPWKSAEIE